MCYWVQLNNVLVHLNESDESVNCELLVCSPVESHPMFHRVVMIADYFFQAQMSNSFSLSFKTVSEESLGFGLTEDVTLSISHNLSDSSQT